MMGRIRMLLDELDLLAEYLPDFDELDEGMQDAFLYDWPNDRAIFEDLDGAYRSGEVGDEERTLFERLRTKLTEMAPAMNEAGLRVPPELLDAPKGSSW
jgi:hypothetical protein